MSTPENPTCRVCGEPLDDSTSAVCNNCEAPFHLRLRNDAGGKDCGEVWVNEQYLSLEFACFSCLRGDPPAGAREEPPVGRGH
ncbi:MAG TPA: hypothetical protein VFT91_10790 [Dehalococcoidia bacterium]|nr:hypothetical protein [Dehalococcoidia bacterium]